MRIAVVVPALNESLHIVDVIQKVPRWVSSIVIVDDGSQDQTSNIAYSAGDARVVILQHAFSQGVGAAIITGYRWVLEHEYDIAVVMAGDGQMSPFDLENVIQPIVDGHADYVQGNRLAWPGGINRIPLQRRIGILILSYLTRLATHLPVYDAQCGYTAIGRQAIEAIDWAQARQTYGYPNDWLMRLSQADMRVCFVPVEPIYANEQSKLRIWHIPPIVRLLMQAICQRWLAKRNKSR